MFRRTTVLNGDVVAAAQRRLAALVEQHTPGDRDIAFEAPETAGATDPGPAGDVGDSAAPDSPTDVSSPPTSSAPARHVGVRQAEYGRWGVSAPHVTVAALAILALVVAVAWWSLRSVPHAESVQLSSHGPVPATLPPPRSAVPTAASRGTPAPVHPAGTTGTVRLVVDVAGKVQHPGIVELPAGSRVVDALAAAGGARPGVALTSLNLARPLVDGEQIVVGIDVPFAGVAPPVSSGSATTSTGSMAAVNLNTATAEQLDTLPGVGPVTAQAILAWRADNGAFTSVDELLEVSGIGDATLADLRPYVYV